MAKKIVESISCLRDIRAGTKFRTSADPLLYIKLACPLYDIAGNKVYAIKEDDGTPLSLTGYKELDDLTPVYLVPKDD